MHEKAKRVQESYIRATRNSFVSAFHNRLLEANDDIREKFDHVDMETQIETLAHTIIMSLLFTDKNHHAAIKYFHNVRESNNRHNLDIAPKRYDSWLECMIEAVAACDPHATEALLSDWHAVMSVAVEHVREGY